MNTANKNNSLRLIVASAVVVTLFYLLGFPVLGLSGLGPAMDPWRGLYAIARSAEAVPASVTIESLDDSVFVAADARGVPQIFASSDRDATIALGFLVARDRLFQLDFIRRVASGRLAEILGPEAVSTDRFLRSTGMEFGARRNLARILASGGLEENVIHWYATGINSYIHSMAEGDLPFEFRLLGYRPSEFELVDGLRVLQYMSYDLSFRPVDRALERFVASGMAEDFEKLYPPSPAFAVPIVSESRQAGLRRKHGNSGTTDDKDRVASAILPETVAEPTTGGGHPYPGFVDGKGSNNWAVSGQASVSGGPMLAGDMHLSLTLPAIWYEAGIHTPTMNLYGVTIPGAPVLVEGFSDSLAWAYTNSGADVVDRYELRLDSSGTHYFYDGSRRDLRTALDTIRVRGGQVVVDTLRYSHHGPVAKTGGKWVATRWTGHEDNRIVEALWGMNHAVNTKDFRDATRKWDTPAQNIAVIDHTGAVSIQVTGYVPIRNGGSGKGILDGSTNASAWVGRIPFDELPQAVAGTGGFVTSTNQIPAGAGYPYYLGYSWNSVFRSNRIDELLRQPRKFSLEDFQEFQADVFSLQARLLIPLLDDVELSPAASAIRSLMQNWDWQMSTSSVEASVFATWVEYLERYTWDESVFRDIAMPHLSTLIKLAESEPDAVWFDRVETETIETASDVFAASLDRVAAERVSRGQSHSHEDPAETADASWGENHSVVFTHLSRLSQLTALGRGPFPFPGYDETLSPGTGSTVTHSASWRMIVELAGGRAKAIGIYPGGQSGNPFSGNYDNSIPDYLTFDYFSLQPLLSFADAGPEYTRFVLHP